MKSDTIECYISRDKARKCYYYCSPTGSRDGLTAMDAMALFIAQLSASIQHCEDNDDNVVFVIDIEKRVK